MLATEFFFSGTLLLRTPDKHIKSQQKSTQAKYKKNASFLPLSFCSLDAMFLCKLALSQISFTTKFHFKWRAHRRFSLRNITITTIITTTVTKF